MGAEFVIEWYTSVLCKNAAAVLSEQTKPYQPLFRNSLLHFRLVMKFQLDDVQGSFPFVSLYLFKEKSLVCELTWRSFTSRLVLSAKSTMSSCITSFKKQRSAGAASWSSIAVSGASHLFDQWHVSYLLDVLENASAPILGLSNFSLCDFHSLASRRLAWQVRRPLLNAKKSKKAG